MLRRRPDRARARRGRCRRCGRRAVPGRARGADGLRLRLVPRLRRPPRRAARAPLPRRARRRRAAAGARADERPGRRRRARASDHERVGHARSRSRRARPACRCTSTSRRVVTKTITPLAARGQPAAAAGRDAVGPAQLDRPRQPGRRRVRREPARAASRSGARSSSRSAASRSTTTRGSRARSTRAPGSSRSS